MSCFYPLHAWRSVEGVVSLGKEKMEGVALKLPCGGCVGCRTAKAKAWTVRCLLELNDHEAASWTTLTYDGANVPNTLSKRDLQLFFKRLRKHATERIRFFASGEYGEQNGRPHYHAILFGPRADIARGDVDRAWDQGNTYTLPITPRLISYTAGYTAKKVGAVTSKNVEYINQDTGEIFEWQEPFLQMSRRPGIGASAKRYRDSWRSYALIDGTRVPVPRYLHEAWKEGASDVEIELLRDEKFKRTLGSGIYDVRKRLSDAEANALAKQSLKNERRKL